MIRRNDANEPEFLKPKHYHPVSDRPSETLPASLRYCTARHCALFYRPRRIHTPDLSNTPRTQFSETLLRSPVLRFKRSASAHTQPRTRAFSLSREVMCTANSYASTNVDRYSAMYFRCSIIARSDDLDSNSHPIGPIPHIANSTPHGEAKYWRTTPRVRLQFGHHF